MAERENRGGIGRLFARARARLREGRHQEDERERSAFHGPSAEPRTGPGRRDYVYREMGGGYGGYGGTADRGPYRPEEGRFGAGYSGYGAPPGGSWREPMAGGGWGPGAGPTGPGTWRGWHAERMAGAPGGMTPMGGRGTRPAGTPMGAVPRSAGPNYPPYRPWGEGSRFGGPTGGPAGPGPQHGREADWRPREARAAHPGEWSHEASGRWGPGPLDKPRGLGAYDTDQPPPMERGTHPEHPGAGMVAPLHGGGWGGAIRSEAGGGHAAMGPTGPSMGRGPGGGGMGPSRASMDRGRGGPGRSGPSDERFTDWHGGSPSSGEVPRWYGGGVRMAREDARGQDFAELGGPRQGRFAREPAEDRGRGPGPLGRPQDRFFGEQGRPYEGWRGRTDEFPIYGQAYAGRGHVGSEDTRDLERWGTGGGDRGSHRRWDEMHEEEDHFGGPRARGPGST